MKLPFGFDEAPADRLAVPVVDVLGGVDVTEEELGVVVLEPED